MSGWSWLGLGLVLGLTSSCAVDGGELSEDPVTGEAASNLDGADEAASNDSVCTSGWLRCHARVQGTASPDGTGFRVKAFAAPSGLGALDLQSAYKIDPTRTATPRPTVGIVIAFGYKDLEADLNLYRSQYGLSACTVASGCLTIVNQEGLSSPLPAEPPLDDDWTLETALDVAMVSAGCPTCKILVVQADDNRGNGLFLGQAVAARLGATVISNSWGGPEPRGATPADMAPFEETFVQDGVATFVAAGDDGFNDGGDGPDYPATSAHTISVGGTRLVRSTNNARGWIETAWSKGGSACSFTIAKPAYQTQSPCAFKATSDIAAVGDPVTGVAVYNTRSNGWVVIGGTSAASPLVAAIYAAAGHGAQDSGGFIGTQTSKLFDVTTGNNGNCGTDTLLCNAATGWDGPSGYGTPNAALLYSGSAPAGPSVADGGDITGGCAAGGGAGAGSLIGLVGLALVGLRRRYRTA